MLVAAACAVALSAFSPVAGVIPVVALQFAKAEEKKIEAARILVAQYFDPKNDFIPKANAHNALMKMGPAANQALVEVLNNSKRSSGERGTAAYLLGQFNLGNPHKSQQTIDALVKAAKDSKQFVRENARGALCNIGPDSVPALLQAIRPADSMGNGHIANALGYFEDRRVIDPLIGVIQDSKIPDYLRSRIVDLLMDKVDSMTGKQILDAKKALDILKDDIVPVTAEDLKNPRIPSKFTLEYQERLFKDLEKAMIKLDKANIVVPRKMR